MLLRRIGLRWTTLQRRASLVPLVHGAASDWPSLPSSLPLPCPAATAVIDGEGDRCELNVTQWLTARRDNAVVQDHMPLHPWVIWLKWRRYEWSYVCYVTTSMLTQRPRPSARRLPDCSLRSRTLVAAFGRYTDLLSADMGVRIIHRSTDFYIVTKI